MYYEELQAIKEKAAKLDDLDAMIGSFYFDKDGNELKDAEAGDLCQIGELAAKFFGYI